MWQQARTGQFVVVSSELVALETLVKPFREGDSILERLFRELFESIEVRLVPVTRRLLEEAARLRAATNLTTPDAIHAATALSEGCALFITNDRAFRRVDGLNVAVLQELA